MRLVLGEQEPRIGIREIHVFDDRDVPECLDRVDIVVRRSRQPRGGDDPVRRELQFRRHDQKQVFSRLHELPRLELRFPLPVGQSRLERRPGQIRRDRELISCRAASLEDMRRIEDRHPVRAVLRCEPVGEEQRRALLFHDPRREHEPLGVLAEHVVAVIFERRLGDLEHHPEFRVDEFSAVPRLDDVSDIGLALRLLRHIAHPSDREHQLRSLLRVLDGEILPPDRIEFSVFLAEQGKDRSVQVVVKFAESASCLGHGLAPLRARHGKRQVG